MFRRLFRPLSAAAGPSRAVVLLSGGLDSATTLAIAKAEHGQVHGLTFDYGQRGAAHEVAAARRVCGALGVGDHRVARIDLGLFGGSALTDRGLAVPKGRSEAQMGASGGIPVTYVPARNTIFLAYALALAEVVAAPTIYIGANAVDYSGYPDCRPEYFQAFQELAKVATKAAVENPRQAAVIHAPLLHMSKIDIIKKGLELGVDFALTHSCYEPADDGKPCGECDSCQLRQTAFLKLGFEQDPVAARYGSYTHGTV